MKKMLLSFLISLVACQPTSLSSAKYTKIADSQVFDETTSSTGISGESAGGRNLLTRISLTYWCSDDYATTLAQHQTDVMIEIRRAGDQTKVCALYGSEAQQPIRDKQIDFRVLAAQCPDLPSEDLEMDIRAAGTSLLIAHGRSTYLLHNSAGVLGAAYSEQPAIMADKFTSPIFPKSSCNVRSEGIIDPLVIALENQIDPQISSPQEGVVFDILGGLSSVPHEARRVAWPRNLSNYFLALPSEDGTIAGIDQLFGNATRGPDGQYAADGFAALAKFDANNDGQIDLQDPVFDKLRLWNDANHNGHAETNEMFELSAKGVVAMDLVYDAHFAEFDQYGNQVRFKSVVRKSTGELGLIFDLWLTYIPVEQK